MRARGLATLGRLPLWGSVGVTLTNFIEFATRMISKEQKTNCPGEMFFLKRLSFFRSPRRHGATFNCNDGVLSGPGTGVIPALDLPQGTFWKAEFLVTRAGEHQFPSGIPGISTGPVK